MTLPSSGTISFSQISVELSQSSTSTRSLNDSSVRTLAGVPSGAISMSNLHGKSAFSVSLDTTTAGGQCNETHPNSCSATTSYVTVTASGASPFTYEWQHVSGTGFGVINPNSASTYFSKTNQVADTPGNANTIQGVYRCKVTDNNGNILYTNNVTVTTEHYYN